jgi:SPX domain protein involved in polyphosphate accumulation
MESPIYMERVERKFEVGICESGVPALSRDLARYVPLHEFIPGQQITLVSSVYFDNNDYDVLRFSLLSMNDNVHFRLRNYESSTYPAAPVSDYWMEIKVKKEEQRRKKRFRIKGEDIAGFFGGKGGEVAERVLSYNRMNGDGEILSNFYRDIKGAVSWLGLKPILLVSYRRIAFQNERERVSLDWDIQYRHMSPRFYRDPSWKEIAKTPVGKEKTVRLELKCPQGVSPSWMADLQRKYPIWESKYYSKFREGMKFLLQGPLKRDRRADSFLEMIEAYSEDWRPLVA